MKHLKYYIFHVILPITSLFAVGLVYKYSVCQFDTKSPDANLICNLNWKDGFILICCYAIVKGLSQILGFETISKRLLITLMLYCISFGIIAWPYLITSFFQPFLVNVFAHALCLIVFIEILYSQHGIYRPAKSERKHNAQMK